MVVGILGDSTPYRGTTSGPCTVVGLHPFIMLIIVTRTWFFRTPVDLGDDDRIGIYYRHLVVELSNLCLSSGSHVLSLPVLIGATIPAVIVVYGITDVFSRDGIFLIIGITGLPA